MWRIDCPPEELKADLFESEIEPRGRGRVSPLCWGAASTERLSREFTRTIRGPARRLDGRGSAGQPGGL